MNEMTTGSGVLALQAGVGPSDRPATGGLYSHPGRGTLALTTFGLEENAMGRPAKNPLFDSLASMIELFPDEWLVDEARRCGFLQRERKVDPTLFFWNLVLGFGASLPGRLEHLRRRYETISGETLVASAFYDRFTPALIKFLQACVQRGLEETVRETEAFPPDLKGLKDILLTDATVVVLHEALRSFLPGTRHPAAAKISAILSVRANSIRSLTITAEKKADVKVLKIGSWIKDNLLLFDLGYYKFALFAKIEGLGGYFLSRVKTNANPVITKVNKVHRGQAIDIKGRKLQDILGNLRRQELDAEVEVTFNRRVYAGNKTRASMAVRLVGIWDADAGEYHLYFTNLPHQAFPPSQIAALYRGRWSIELLFKELKSRYALDVLNTDKPIVAKALILSALLTLIASRRLLNVYRKKAPPKERDVTQLRWSAMLAEAGNFLVLGILRHLGRKATLETVLNFYAHGAVRPNPFAEQLSDVFNI